MVVTVGRGSVLQTVISTFVSFLFFAFHVKMCEMEMLFSRSLPLYLSHDVWSFTVAANCFDELLVRALV